MPEINKIYHLFLSHNWKLGGEYEQLLRLLKQAPDFHWKNCSRLQCDSYLDPDSFLFEKEFTLSVHSQIKPASCVLILAGLYPVSDWIQTEINIANYYQKPMIGIFPQGPQTLSLQVQSAVKEMVGWETSEIVGAIKRHSL